MKKTKPFTIEAYKAMTESEHVETKDGSPVRIICDNKKGGRYPVVALVTNEIGEEVMDEYSELGEYNAESESKLDLVIIHETITRTGWTNVYRNGKSRLASVIHRTKTEALELANTESGYIDTVEINWEE